MGELRHISISDIPTSKAITLGSAGIAAYRCGKAKEVAASNVDQLD